jgi:hypothetical protein
MNGFFEPGLQEPFGSHFNALLKSMDERKIKPIQFAQSKSS